ncbi:hypothetical protein OESDEN_04769 [Oesophagostomum dentatum]|uniref:Cytochrome P450 n=1 Tax=Oesophagostomum dentatum TaxID=61180 RepID=A0A0B1TCK8_OESDE|nr:hypothetical protein OESDEN_04769 [Oesophagostomum dentatum]
MYFATVVPSTRLALRKLYMATARLRQIAIPTLFDQIYRTIDERIETRKNMKEGEESEPTDFIDLFLDARAEQHFDNNSEFTKTGVHVEKQLTREEIAAQCFVFLLAGFDTTANSLAYVEKQLTREEIAAQCFVFLLAGFDTTANSLAYVTYLLAKNPDAQRVFRRRLISTAAMLVCLAFYYPTISVQDF